MQTKRVRKNHLAVRFNFLKCLLNRPSEFDWLWRSANLTLYVPHTTVIRLVSKADPHAKARREAKVYHQDCRLDRLANCKEISSFTIDLIIYSYKLSKICMAWATCIMTLNLITFC